MTYGIIDVREWQTTVDLKTGKKVDVDNELTKIAKKIIGRNYYPGDLELKSINWVTDVALDLYSEYKPDFMFLNYAQPYLLSRFTKLSNSEWNELINLLFDNINRFIMQSGFVPVVVGLGSMTPLINYIDLSGLDGVALCGGMSAYYAGLFDPTPEDLKYLESIPHIERIVNKQQFIRNFGGSKDFINRFPDYLIEAAQGYTFKAYGSMARTIFKIPAKNATIPVFCPLGNISSIVDIKKVIERKLIKNKIALIVLEGVGAEDFRYSHTLCSNKLNWYTYDQGENHYLAIMTGKHFQSNDYPPGYKYYIEDSEYKKYPYSGCFTELPSDTIASRLNIKTAAVGSRSILTHAVSCADICIECMARGLYNYGTMAVINTFKK
jgi:hypothetical protein